MADLSSFDNFFYKFPPKPGLQTKQAQHGIEKAQRHIKKSEIASEIKPDSKCLFHTLLFDGTCDNSDLFTSYVSSSRFCTFVRHFAFLLTLIPYFKPLFLLSVVFLLFPLNLATISVSSLTTAITGSRV